MKIEDLEPCPFCGHSAREVEVDATEENMDDPNAGGSYIECTFCHASSAIVFGFKEGLIERWNRRDGGRGRADAQQEARSAQARQGQEEEHERSE